MTKWQAEEPQFESRCSLVVAIDRGFPKHKVILHGGLGNQLFQWAYGHQLSLLGYQVEFVFFHKEYILEHTKTSLGSFLPSCSHGKFVEVVLPRQRAVRIFLDPTHGKYVFRKFPRHLQDTTVNPFLGFDAEAAIRSRNHFGYYQNSNSIQNIEGVLTSELWGALKLRQRTSLELELEGTEVIHIRQGDTRTANNMRTVGVLSSNYYSQLPRKTSTTRIVLTDDIEGAKKVLSGTQVDAVFGPDDLDAYQALAVMAHASSLFAANSTLSWWGGLLAQQRGAHVYIPEPFFRKFDPNPGLAFAFSGFELMESHFLSTLD